MDRNRHLISHSIQKAKKGKSYHDFHFFLFNDMLLVAKERKTAKEILSKMLERKEKNFPNIKIMILDFKISCSDEENHLTVISSPIN